MALLIKCPRCNEGVTAPDIGKAYCENCNWMSGEEKMDWIAASGELPKESCEVLFVLKSTTRTKPARLGWYYKTLQYPFEDEEDAYSLKEVLYYMRIPPLPKDKWLFSAGKGNLVGRVYVKAIVGDKVTVDVTYSNDESSQSPIVLQAGNTLEIFSDPYEERDPFDNALNNPSRMLTGIESKPFDLSWDDPAPTAKEL